MLNRALFIITTYLANQLNACLAWLQMELARLQIYLQFTKIESQHFGVLLKLESTVKEYYICAEVFDLKYVTFGQQMSKNLVFWTNLFTYLYVHLKPWLLTVH